MSLSTWAKAAILDALYNSVALDIATPYLSLHTDYPGLTGDDEFAGGTYARQAGSFGAATDEVANDAVITFTGLVPATVYAVGAWDALSGGNFIQFGWIGALVDFFTGKASDDVITSYGHGLVDDDRVTFEGRDGAGLPTGITVGVVYFVRDAATDTFKIALTSGGAAINLTADGEGAVIKVTPKVIANTGDKAEIGVGELVFGLV